MGVSKRYSLIGIALSMSLGLIGGWLASLGESGWGWTILCGTYVAHLSGRLWDYRIPTPAAQESGDA